jgi:two-component system, OmpR family, response regulator MprA
MGRACHFGGDREGTALIETAAADRRAAAPGRGLGRGAPPARVLVVGGDGSRRNLLAFALELEGYRASPAPGGLQALAFFRRAADQPDAVVLELPLGRLAGADACRAIRAATDVPLLILSQRPSVEERIRALDAGADISLPKPFVFAELLACLRALLRRTTPADRRVRYADLELDPDEQRVERAGRPLQLTSREFGLLQLFLSRPHRVLSRSAISDAVWGYDLTSRSRAVDVHIASLRRKIEAGGRQRLLHTVHGVGYVLRDQQ